MQQPALASRLLSLALFSAVAPVGSAMASGFYGGDPYAAYPNIPLFAGYQPASIVGMAYDDFDWPAGTGTIGMVGGNFWGPSVGSFDSAYWEIRSGMSAGNGGTLVASGWGTPTVSATGFTQGGSAVWRVELAITGVTLASGSYWFAVAVDDPAHSGAFVANTTGVNGIGPSVGNNALLYDNGTSFWNFRQVGAGGDGYAGVDASYFISTVPAPGVLALLGLGGLGTVRRRR